MNNVILIGRLTKDLEIKEVGENKVVNFTLACQRNYKKKDDESHKYAEKADEMYNAVFMAQRNLSNSFTFTLSMLCLGIIIIISFVLIF